MKTIQTRGRTLDIAAPVYDFTEPLVLFGKQKQINELLLELLDIKAEQKICLLLILTVTGCAYMGLHGKSIQKFPDIHEGIVEDSQCLSCHHPDNADKAPASPYPKFTGCLKCHNDKL